MSSAPRDEIIITDIVERVVEKDLLSPVNRRGKWRIVDYELEKIGPGRSVLLPGWTSGSLTIRLNVSGHYRICLVSRYAQIRAKLTGDRCFDVCEEVNRPRQGPATDTNNYREGYYDAEEVFWREANLTGQDFILDGRSPLSLLAIRLTPTDPPKADTGEARWPMFFTNDGGCLGQRLHSSPDDLFEWAERVPDDGCAKVMVYGGISGDICSHFTQVGTEFGSLDKGGDPTNKHAKTIAANLKQYREWGINPARAVVEYAHNRGWELHFYIRMRSWGSAYPICGPYLSRFYLDHPEYHLAGPAGEPVMGLSVAYPEAREHLVKLYAELAEFGADGVSPCFVRGGFTVLYEPIMVEGFKKKHGLDPRELDELDDRWLDYTAEVTTTFMREMKEAIGPGCRLSPIVHGTQALNRRYGLDIAAWVKAGIVDDLFVLGHRYDRHDGHYAGGPEHLEFEYFQGLPGRENVRLWPMFYGYGTASGYVYEWEDYWTALQKWLDDGADGYGIWDMAAFPTDARANIWDLGKIPRPNYRKPDRLVDKYELVRWDGYMWNRYTPIDAW